jgi:hypothetical protein
LLKTPLALPSHDSRRETLKVTKSEMPEYGLCPKDMGFAGVFKTYMDTSLESS